jgi:hypothetical protein
MSILTDYSFYLDEFKKTLKNKRLINAFNDFILNRENIQSIRKVDFQNVKEIINLFYIFVKEKEEEKTGKTSDLMELFNQLPESRDESLSSWMKREGTNLPNLSNFLQSYYFGIKINFDKVYNDLTDLEKSLVDALKFAKKLEGLAKLDIEYFKKLINLIPKETKKEKEEKKIKSLVLSDSYLEMVEKIRVDFKNDLYEKIKDNIRKIYDGINEDLISKINSGDKFKKSRFYNEHSPVKLIKNVSQNKYDYEFEKIEEKEFEKVSTEYSESKSEIESQNFKFKIQSKLSGILVGEELKYLISNDFGTSKGKIITVESNDYSYEIRINWIINVSVLGNYFYQLPITFHNFKFGDEFYKKISEQMIMKKINSLNLEI